jgi:hypothetical protein
MENEELSGETAPLSRGVEREADDQVPQTPEPISFGVTRESRVFII